MEEKTLIDWLRLINTPDIGPVTFFKLLKQYGTAEKVLDQIGVRKNLYPYQDALKELETARRQGIEIISIQDPLYPEGLRLLNDAPPLIYAKGRTELLKYPVSVSVVGSRNASVDGRKIASKIAYDLTQNNVLIVSGMARGIDAAAHKGAMYALNKNGPTIAVLGTGADVAYPLENKDIYAQISKQGLIISEYPLGTEPQTQNFPRRNRIISALSAATLVVEASLNSGSLITARLALEQGKDVFAVPGSPLDGHSAGSNKLIKDGACLTECADDILETLNFSAFSELNAFSNKDLFSKHFEKKEDLSRKPLDKKIKTANIPEKKIVTDSKPLLSLISQNGIETDELIRLSGQSAAEIMMQITELELEGCVTRVGGSKIVLKKDKKS